MVFLLGRAEYSIQSLIEDLNKQNDEPCEKIGEQQPYFLKNELLPTTKRRSGLTNINDFAVHRSIRV